MSNQLKLLATGQIIPTALHSEMERSYLEYAMSVIVGRALPDVRDGLKPVHRRILFAMHELGLTPDRPFRKCARVVGDVLGKYHPHGDQSVYDALVRLVQTFSSRYPLLAGHGNFGSVDNDPPAAMRYTETRLAPIATGAALNDISEAIVDFTYNFDNSQQEPTVLPA
ncbi:MAG: DNA gyrase subunit A, partial [Microcystaceae cyanobacterium]